MNSIIITIKDVLREKIFLFYGADRYFLKKIDFTFSHFFIVVGGWFCGAIVSIALLIFLFAIFQFRSFSSFFTLDEPKKGIIDPSQNLSLIATTTIAADLLRHLGGDRVRVESLMGVGIDPHTYIAREGDLQKILGADAIFYHGLNLEAKMTHIFYGMNESKRKKSYDMSEWIDKKDIIKAGNHPDPHIWFDIRLWRSVAKGAAKVLGELDPHYKKDYEKRLKDYLERLGDLEKKSRDLFGRIPRNFRVLVTGHDAFSYFAAAYDFRVLAPRGINTQSQAGIKDLQNLKEKILDERVGAFFVETSLSSRELYAVEAAVKESGGYFTWGGSLYSDALGDDPVNTYEKVFWHNAKTIVMALEKSLCHYSTAKINFSEKNNKKETSLCVLEGM